MISSKRKLVSCAMALGLSLSVNLGFVAPSLGQSSDTPPVLQPKFTATCTDTDRAILSKAHSNMAKMLDDALDGVTVETSSIEYTESFGASDFGRDFTVLARLLLLRIGAATVEMTANCVPAGADAICDAGTWAYVSKQQLGAADNKYNINFCRSFFDATDEDVQAISMWKKASVMQGAVFLHELTHFSWATKALLREVGMEPDDSAQDQAGSKDVEYDAEGVKYLAGTDPEQAILNADSYHIFIMRLAVRKGLIYN